MYCESSARSASGSTASLRRILLATLCALAPAVAPAGAGEPGGTEHGGLAEVGAKLADPTSNLWSMQAVLEAPAFFDGDLNTGDPEVGSSLTLQPLMPLPLYGQGEDQWKLITRPVLPVILSQPVPRGSNSFYDKGAWET